MWKYFCSSSKKKRKKNIIIYHYFVSQSYVVQGWQEKRQILHFKIPQPANIQLFCFRIYWTKQSIIKIVFTSIHSLINWCINYSLHLLMSISALKWMRRAAVNVFCLVEVKIWSMFKVNLHWKWQEISSKIKIIYYIIH